MVMDYALSRPFEIAIVGSPDDEATMRLLRAAMSGFRPHEDRGLVDGKPAAYVCRDFACQAPVTKVEALRAQLEQGSNRS